MLHRFLTKGFLPVFCLLLWFAPVLAEEPVDRPGSVCLFDGRTLSGWEGDPVFWSVCDGCLTAISSPENPVQYSSHLIWTGQPVGDFELLVDFRLESGNSGVMYRSVRDPGRKWGLNGYQADMDAANAYTGIVYGEGIGGILVQRGQECKIGADRKPVVVAAFGDSAELARIIKTGDWNTYKIVAQGAQITQYINGVKVSQLIEEDPAAVKAGTFGFQIHPGPPMKVQFKNIYLKSL